MSGVQVRACACARACAVRVFVCVTFSLVHPSLHPLSFISHTSSCSLFCLKYARNTSDQASAIASTMPASSQLSILFSPARSERERRERERDGGGGGREGGREGEMEGVNRER